MTIDALRAIQDEELPARQRPSVPRSARPQPTTVAPPPPSPTAAPGPETDQLPLGQLLAWADQHPDPAVQEQGTQARAALSGLRRRHTAETERLRKEHATWRKLGKHNLDQVHETNARLRADQATALGRIREAVRRLAAHAAGFQDVLDETDRGPWGKTVGADIAELRRMADEDPLSPYYEHPECGFHWHGRDGMDIPLRDGQPVCPRCELAKAEQQLTALQRRRDEVGVECKRRGKRVLKQSEQIRALERQIDAVRCQLGAEILRAGQAETRVRELETATADTQARALTEAADQLTMDWGGPDHEEDTGPHNPPVRLRPEEYTVTAVPDDVSPDAHVWALTVRHRGDGRWAVQHGEHACLGADGEWAQGVKEYDRGDQWLDEHRFDLPTALRLASAEAPHVTVNGRTAADVLGGV